MTEGLSIYSVSPDLLTPKTIRLWILSYDYYHLVCELYHEYTVRHNIREIYVVKEIRKLSRYSLRIMGYDVSSFNSVYFQLIERTPVCPSYTVTVEN